MKPQTCAAATEKMPYKTRLNQMFLQNSGLKEERTKIRNKKISISTNTTNIITGLRSRASRQMPKANTWLNLLNIRI